MRAKLSVLAGWIGATEPGRESVSGLNKYPTHIIPGVALSSICPIDGPLTVVAPEPDSGEVSPFELICIIAIVRRHAPRQLFESDSRFGGLAHINNTSIVYGVFK